MDKSKENIQPLRGGRDVARLEYVLDAQEDAQKMELIKQERREFEHRIETYDGPDPLDPWFQYICWIEQTYPKKGYEGSLIKIIEQCLSKFEKCEQYYQDRRMVKLWMKYFDTRDNPTELYQMLHSQGIGTTCTEMYLGWAYYFHAAGDFKRAYGIYQLGVAAHAQPYDELEQAITQFSYSYTEHHLVGDARSRDRSTTVLMEQRQALTTLRAIKRRNIATAPSQRTGDNIIKMPGAMSDQRSKSNRGYNTQLHVFEDDCNDGMAGPSHQPSNSILTRCKSEENSIEPGPWSKTKSLEPTGHITPRPTPYSVHEDNPTPTFAPCYEDFSDWVTRICVPDPERPDVIAMYIKDEVYCEENNEYSFEEILANKYFKRIKESTIIHKKSDHPEVIYIDDEYESMRLNSEHQHMHSMHTQEDAYGNHILQNSTSAQQVIVVKSPYRSYSQGPHTPVNMHASVHDGNSQRGYMNDIMSPHMNPAEHMSQTNQLHTHQMTSQSLDLHGQRMATSGKESMREMDNWYGTPSKNYTLPPSNNVSQQAVQPFTIYQDSLTEHIPAGPSQSNQMDNPHINEFNHYAPSPNSQHVYQISHSQHSQHEQHSQHHQQLIQHTEHQSIEQHPQHQTLQQHPQHLQHPQHSLQPHTPHQLIQHQEFLHHSHNNRPITEHNYVNNENMQHLEHSYGGKTPISEHHYGHHVVNPNPVSSPHVNRMPQHYTQATEEMTSIFSDTCNTQAFDIDIYKAQVSTPVKHAKIHGYESDDSCSPNVMQQQMNMQKQSIQQVPHAPIIMGGGHLSTILESTSEYQQSSAGSSVASSGPDSVSLNRNNSKSMSSQHSMAQQAHNQMQQSSEYIARATPDMNSYSTNQLNHFTNQAPATSYSISTSSMPYQNQTQTSFKAETPIKKSVIVSEASNNRSAVPVTPNKYTSYRNSSFIVQSPASTTLAVGFELPATPEAVLSHGPQESVRARIQLKETRTPNISRSMQNTLHISKDRNFTNSLHIKNINEDSEDLEMEYQESEVHEIEDDPEPIQISFQQREINKDKIEEKIKAFLDKDMIDPFNSELCEAFLNQEGFPHAEDRNSYIPVRTVPQLKQNTTVSLGPKIFSVEKELGKGAFGSIFRAIDNESGNIVALKYQKPCRIWEYYICQEIRKRIKNEHRDILCGYMEITTAIVGPSSSILVSQFSNYGSLLNVSNKIRTGTTKPINEYVVMLITAQLLSVVEELHKINIIHGDIKPDNILLMSMPKLYITAPSVQLIDFGCAIDMSLFPEGTEFKKVITTDGFTCSEMLDGRPWTYQTDLFCMAATTHVLLFGEYMKMHKTFGSKWEINAKIPRYFNKKVWETYFDKLLNIPDSKNLPNLKELRKSLMEEALNYTDLHIKLRQMENVLRER